MDTPGFTVEVTPAEAIPLVTRLIAVGWIATWAAIANGIPAGSAAIAIAGLGINVAGLHDLAEHAETTAGTCPCPCGNH